MGVAHRTRRSQRGRQNQAGMGKCHGLTVLEKSPPSTRGHYNIVAILAASEQTTGTITKVILNNEDHDEASRTCPLRYSERKEN